MPIKCPECETYLENNTLSCPSCGKRGLFVGYSDDTFSDLLKHFPNGMTPRPQQKTILKKIANGLDQGYKYILLDAGTGIGKSAIAITLANYFSSAYIITITKQLQDQYHNDFNIQVLKGRGNFDCIEGIDFNNATCDDGLCQTADLKCDHGISRKGEFLCFNDSMGEPWYYNNNNPCHYWLQKGRSYIFRCTLMNYASFFPEMNYMDHFGNVLAVFDEVHNMESNVMKQISHTITNKKLHNDFIDYMDYISKEGQLTSIPHISNDAYTDDVDFWKEYIIKFIKDYKLLLKISAIPQKKRKSAMRNVQQLQMIKNELENYPKEWVIEFDREKQKIIFKPIEVSRFVPNYLLHHTDYCLLMSATILDKNHFCKWHGINPKDVLYIQFKSPFKVENRPIYLKTIGRMSRKYIDETKPRSIAALRTILQKHKTEKGLIHTHSHKLATYISETLRRSSHNCI